MLDPLIVRAARALQQAGYRIPSIKRQEAPLGSKHRQGCALDVARMEKSDNYTLGDAAAIRGIAEAAVPTYKWVAVAENDHVHLQPDTKRALGESNVRTNYQLQIREVGDMRASEIRNAMNKLQVRRYRRGIPEIGDATTPTEATVLETQSRGVNELVRALNNPGQEKSLNLTVAAEQSAPEMLDLARKVQLIRAADYRTIDFVHYDNAEEISSSLGHTSDLSQAALRALATTIETGVPPFEPVPFLFNVVAANLFDFFPSAALSIPNGGPLPVGTPVLLAGLHVELTVPVLNARPGIPFTHRVDYDAQGNFMQQTAKIGDGTESTVLNSVWGQLAGGRARMNPINVTTIPGVGVPGVTFPRITIAGLPTAVNNFQVFGRFFLPGDYAIDRFAELVG